MRFDPGPYNLFNPWQLWVSGLRRRGPSGARRGFLIRSALPKTPGFTGGRGRGTGSPRPEAGPVRHRPRPPLLTKGGSPVKFARTCGGFAAVVSVGIVLALSCEHFAALLDTALAF